MPITVVGPNKAATSNTAGGVERPWQHGTLYAAGLHWVFYADTGFIKVRTSADGVTWSAATNVVATLHSFSVIFSLYYDGTYIHYVRGGDPTEDLLYRRGAPQTDGTITWSAAAQIAVAATSTIYRYEVGIAVDTNGCPWISWENIDTGPTTTVWMTGSTATDGTWSTRSTFPQMIGSGGPNWSMILPLGAGKVYVCYVDSPSFCYGRLWDGSSLGSQETMNANTPTTGAFDMAFTSNLVRDEVYFAYQPSPTPDEIRFRVRTSAGWQAEETARSGRRATLCLASYDATNGVFLFFGNVNPAVFPTGFLYRQRTSAGVWDSSDQAFVTMTSPRTVSGAAAFQCSQDDYGQVVAVVYEDDLKDIYQAFLTGLQAPAAGGPVITLMGAALN